MNDQGQSLSSWKEIAVYLGRTVRTCQRLEIIMGLPVHRLDGSPKARVFAYPAELDAWLEHKINEHKRSRKAWPLWTLAALLTVALAFALLYRTGEGPRRSGMPVPPDPPSIAVLYFKNNTGDKAYDIWRSGLSDSFITKLSQSRRVRVVDASQIYAVLKRLALLDNDSLTPEELDAIARRSSAGYLVRGSLSKAGDRFRIDLTLQEARNLQVAAAESIEGNGEESLFAMIDGLAGRVESGMGLTAAAPGSETGRSIINITTNSMEAYKHYLLGFQLSIQGAFEPAVAHLEKAVDLDPRLAMAHLVLGLDYYQWGRPEGARAMARAFELRPRVSERERLLIEAEYYQYASEEHWSNALEAFERLVALYPWDLTAGEEYGFLLWRMDEWDRAIEVQEKLLRYKPESIGIYQTLAWCHLAKGEPERARRILEGYFETIGESSWLRGELACLYLLSGELSRAKEEIARAAASEPGLAAYSAVDVLLEQRDFGALEDLVRKYESGPVGWWFARVRSMSAIWRGRVLEAQKSISLEIDKEKDLDPEIRTQLILRQAGLLQAIGDFSGAAAVADMALRLAIGSGRGLFVCAAIYRKGAALALKGDLGGAEGALGDLRQAIDRGAVKRRAKFLAGLRGLIALQRKDYSKAREELRSALGMSGIERVCMENPRLELLFYLAKACEGSRLYQEAQTYLELVGRPTLCCHFDPLQAVLRMTSFYELGRVLERMGDRAGAAAAYRYLLDICKDADPGLPEVEDARRRLAEPAHRIRSFQ